MFSNTVKSDFQAELRETLRQAAEQRSDIRTYAKRYNLPERVVAWYAEFYEDWQEVLRFNSETGVLF